MLRGWGARVAGAAQEALQLVFGHAITELGSAWSKTVQLSLAQPAPHRFGRGAESLGDFTYREESLISHTGGGFGLIRRRGCRDAAEMSGSHAF